MKIGPLFLSALLMAGCAHHEEETSKPLKPTVYTVNYPLAYFAERVAGDHIKIVFPEMEGDPAFWEPSPEQVLEFQGADLILLNGADYAKWVPSALLPEDRMVNTAQGLEAQFIALDGSGSHAHAAGDAHVHGDVAFTLWLNPAMAVHQAKTIYASLSRMIALDDAALDALVADLEKLDADLKEVFQPLEKKPLLGSHPVYQYLEKRYNLNMESVHWEPDSEPDAAMWRELEDILETHNADVMLWEDEPLPSVKKALTEKGIKSVVFNPCGNRPVEGEYLTVMMENLEAVKRLQ